jgi:hypothetical protein
MIGYRFNTIGVSDGISMGTSGMGFSLQSRDLIADSIETVMSAQVRAWALACVCVRACVCVCVWRVGVMVCVFGRATASDAHRQ